MLNTLLETRIPAAPDAVAFVFGDGRITYAELGRRSARLARHLQACGVGRETRVAIHLERGIDLATAVVAVVRAGAAYVVVDDHLPNRRVRDILDDAKPAVLLRRSARGPASAGTRSMALDDEAATIACHDDGPLAGTWSPDQLFSVVYTSGTTGSPKGVLIPLRAALNRLAWLWTHLPFEPGDVVLAHRSCMFVGSAWDLFGGLLQDAATVLVDREAAQDPRALWTCILDAGATHCAASPSLWTRLLDEAQRQGLRSVPLRVARSAGEPLREALVDQWRRTLPAVRLLNVYGASECSPTAVSDATSRATTGAERVPAGTPIDGVDVHVLDDDLGRAAFGAEGQIAVAGDCLARGYLNRPALTAEHFVPDPCGSAPGTRMFLTGDYGRLDERGALHVTGRRDDQVKIRGVRVELAEVQGVLEACPGVQQAFVMATGAVEDRSLAAFVVASPGVVIAPSALRSFACERLPDAMVPSSYVQLEAIPLGPTGKVDRNRLALHAAALPEAPGETALAPGTEEWLAALWGSLLGLDRVGPHDDFFESGGHSLLAMQLVSRVQGEHGIELPVRTVFAHPTVAALAPLIDEERRRRTSSRFGTVPRVDASGDVPLSINQEALLFADWWERVRGVPAPPLHTSFSVRLEGDLDSRALEAALRAVIARHDVLRTSIDADDVADPSAVGARLAQVTRIERSLLTGGRSPVAHSSIFRQAIAPAVDFSLDVRDCVATTDPARAAAVHDAFARAADRFDCGRPPLLRGTLLRLDAMTHVLVMVFHHLVSDAWSLQVIRRELQQLYAASRTGTPPPLQHVALQFADFAAWERRWLAGPRGAELMAYWTERWRGYGDALVNVAELPFVRPGGAGFACGRESMALDPDLVSRLRVLARERSLTLYAVTLAALFVLLHAYTGRRRLAVWGAFANRVLAESDAAVGWFSNSHLVGCDLGADPTVGALLERVRESLLDGIAHQALPTGLLGVAVAATPPARAARHVFRDTILFDRTMAPAESRFDGLVMTPIVGPGVTSDKALSLFLSEHADRATLTAQFFSHRFAAEDIRGLLAGMRGVLDAMTRGAGARLTALAAAARQDGHAVV